MLFSFLTLSARDVHADLLRASISVGSILLLFLALIVHVPDACNKPYSTKQIEETNLILKYKTHIIKTPTGVVFIDRV